VVCSNSKKKGHTNKKGPGGTPKKRTWKRKETDRGKSHRSRGGPRQTAGEKLFFLEKPILETRRIAQERRSLKKTKLTSWGGEDCRKGINRRDGASREKKEKRNSAAFITRGRTVAVEEKRGKDGTSLI